MELNDNFTWTEDSVTTTIETGTSDPAPYYTQVDYPGMAELVFYYEVD